MEFVNINPTNREVSWDKYFRYLEQQKEKFPADLYEYAINWDNYSLDSKDSLHDSWLESIEFNHTNKSMKVDNISLRMLGAYHDRYHELRYIEVQSFNMELRGSDEPGYRDLLAHEFRVTNQCFTHEICFSNLGFISVQFKKLTVNQEKI